MACVEVKPSTVQVAMTASSTEVISRCASTQRMLVNLARADGLFQVKDRADGCKVVFAGVLLERRIASPTMDQAPTILRELRCRAMVHF